MMSAIGRRRAFQAGVAGPQGSLSPAKASKSNSRRAIAPAAQKRLARWLGRSGPMDYTGVCRAVERWHPHAGLVYFHFLLDGLSRTGAMQG